MVEVKSLVPPEGRNLRDLRAQPEKGLGHRATRKVALRALLKQLMKERHLAGNKEGELSQSGVVGK